MFCSGCGTQASEGAQVCNRCGRALDATVAAGPVSEADLLEAAIGPNNADYYLERFSRFAAGRGQASWNWPAFFVTLIWMVYRKMWLYAALYYFALPPVLLIVCGLLFLVLPPVAALIVGCVLFFGTLFGVVPVYANLLYYKTVRERLRIAARPNWSPDKQLRYVERSGGTSVAGLVVVLVLFVGLVPAMIGILAAIAIPAYQDYTLRAQVSEGLALGVVPRGAVEDYFIANGVLPADRAAAGLTPAPAAGGGKYVSGIDIRDGRIEIAYGNAANSLLAGKMLVLTPYGVQGAQNWRVVWRCGLGSVPADATHELTEYSPGNIEPKWLPSLCRPGGLPQPP